MKWLSRRFEGVKEQFEEGGKLYKVWPLFDATETFLYRLPVRTVEGAHVRDAFDIKRMMMTVVLAIFPTIIFGMYNIGYQFYLAQGVNPAIAECFVKGAFVLVPMYAVVFVTGGLWEVVFALVRKHEINEGFFVTGTLIPLIMPPDISLWMVAAGTSFGVVMGKEVFGGTGMNIFNPALVARAFIFFAYPQAISGDNVWTLLDGKAVDAYTMATPLSVGTGATENIISSLQGHGYTLQNMFFGFIPGSVGETSTLLILIGGIFLIITGVGSWRIMVSVFAGGYVIALLMNSVSPSPESLMSLPPHYHFVMGGFAFGAVYMATDPVSASNTNAGKYVYGFLIGALAIIVRVMNPAFPEGMMLSILFMNLFSPLIDYGVMSIHMRRRMRRAA